MTAFVSGFSRWYAEGVAGARLATNAASSGERDAAPSGTGTAPLVNAGSIGRLPQASASPTACSPWGNLATKRRLSAPSRRRAPKQRLRVHIARNARAKTLF